MREYVRDRDRLEHIVEAIDNILNYSNADIAYITGLSVEDIEML